MNKRWDTVPTAAQELIVPACLLNTRLNTKLDFLPETPSAHTGHGSADLHPH